MSKSKLTAADFRQMVVAGNKRLEDNVELVNSLNVFPVPDGDTGTNMNMTFNSGTDRLMQSPSNHVGELTEVLSKGVLMGARGNSGVILSQVFRGFSQAVKEYEDLDAEALVAAFAGGVEAAYKAVMKPVEGTILTVAREAAVAGELALEETQDVVEIMEAIVRGGQESLERTPDLLPVLKQVGVVDSGGRGLMCIYEGFLASLTGEEVPELSSANLDTSFITEDLAVTDDHPMSLDDITYGFCTEIMVRLGERPTTDKVFDLEDFRQILNTKGDSLLVIADDEIVKVHVHTENPGEIMQLGQEYGELIKIKVDNMREQVREIEAQKEALSASVQASSPVEEALEPYGVIAVASGAGLEELFRSIGVDYVLAGGQTMNPSTQDFIDAMEEVKAERLILLPNNKNIQMAAEQATQVADVESVVIPTTSIPEGIGALMGLSPHLDLAENAHQMEEMARGVTSGQITYSIRETEIDGVHIDKDDFMGLVNGDIMEVAKDRQEALEATLTRMLTDDSEIAMILVGEDGDLEEAQAVADLTEADWPDLEIEVIQTDQPVYHYILSVE